MKRLLFLICTLLSCLTISAQTLPPTLGGHKIYVNKTFDFVKTNSGIQFEHLGFLNGHIAYSGFNQNVMYQIEYEDSDPRKRIIHQYISIDSSDADDRAMMQKCQREIIAWGGYSSKLDFLEDKLIMLYSDGCKLVVSLETRADKGTKFFMIEASYEKDTTWDHEPKNNLRKSFDELEREFSELRFIRKTEYGDMYQDGFTEDGISAFFYIRNDRVVRECMQVASNDGFPKLWFDSMKDSYMENGNLGITATIGANLLKMRFSSFTIILSYTQGTQNITKLEYIFNSDLVD